VDAAADLAVDEEYCYHAERGTDGCAPCAAVTMVRVQLDHVTIVPERAAAVVRVWSVRRCCSQAV
jgi:hypothetical protein